MPELAPLPFLPDQKSGLESLAGASPLALNVVIDAAGAVRRRPGIRQHPSFVDSVIDSGGLDAVHLTQGGDLYAIGANTPNRSIYRVTASGFNELSTSPGRDLRGMKRPMSAETEAMVLLVAGAEPQRILLSTHQSERLPGSPPEMTHVIAQAARVLGNDIANPSQVAYSDLATGGATAGHETWGIGNGDAGFISAEARPDPVVAVAENTNDAFIWGKTNLEVWTPDPQFVYSRAIVREYGLSAPYSVVKRDQRFAWIDHERRIWWSDGREFQELSEGIQKTLDDMPTVEDAHGFWLRLGPVDALVWTFPTDGRTFAYQVRGGWSQWQGYGPGPLGVTGKSGDALATAAGRVGQFSFDAEDDFDERVQVQVETGYLSRGTGLRKNCLGITLTVRADSQAAAGEQAFWLQWRDSDGDWTEPIQHSLADGPELVLRSLGVYRRRSWRLIFSGSGPFTLAAAEEEFEVLGN